MVLENELKVFFEGKSENLFFSFIDPRAIIFEERVKLKCMFCERFGNNRRCPPYPNGIDIKTSIGEYEKCMVVYTIFHYKNEQEMAMVRRESTNYLHKSLLELDKILWKNEQVLGVSFIGGSCKLCKDGCAPICRNPVNSRIPVEATGINVLSTIKNELNIEIKFNEPGILYRVGLLFW